MKKVIVVGGGASGMMAAIKAAERGNSVVLIEKNEKLGKKLFITGKGRCNVTTSKDVQEIIENIQGNSEFMYSSLYSFTNQDLMNMLEAGGVKLKVERGDRVFPVSDKSSDIIKCFENYLNKNNVDIILNSQVIDINIDSNSKVSGVILKDGRTIKGDAVIFSIGGASYPLTGSTGDGYKICKKLGHTIESIKPSLIPLVVKEKWIEDLMGLSLKNSQVIFKYNGRKIYEDFGELLFTHFGLSGPVILSASRKVVDFLPGEIEVYIDLKPALNEEELDKRIVRDFDKYKNKLYRNALDDLLPQKMIPVIINLSGIPEEKQVNSITKQERHKLLELLKAFKLRVIGTRPIEEAIVTRGGVNVKEVNPSTMESKIIKNLYITGELLDVDAPTGGFNLQIAFSTGYCAGMSC